MSEIIQGLAVFFIGGVGYALIEILWRGKTHWTMMLAGGICLLILFSIFDNFRNMSLWKCALIGAAVITAVELAFGWVLNKRLNMKIWDYSDKRFNFKGQICPMYSFLWGVLSVPASRLCLWIGDLFEKLF